MNPVHFSTVSQNEPLSCSLPTDAEKAQWAAAIGKFIETYSPPNPLPPDMQVIANHCGLDSETLSPEQALDLVVASIQTITPPEKHNDASRDRIIWAIAYGCRGDILGVGFDSVSLALKKLALSLSQKSDYKPTGQRSNV